MIRSLKIIGWIKEYHTKSNEQKRGGGEEVIVIISIVCKSKNLAKILNEKEKKESL